MQKPVLEVKNLTKKFPARGWPAFGGGDFTAVDNISFSLADGEILGLLGPNGAGKTTTIQMLLGVMEQTEGSITYFGKPFTKHREEVLKRINFASTYIGLPFLFTVEEILNVFARLYEVEDRQKRIQKLLVAFEIDHLRPDGKSQVTVEYENDKPVGIETVVIAAQHDDGIPYKKIRSDIMKHVIKPVCGSLLNKKAKIYINETGKFVTGGPQGDTGVTGRKIIVDTYGGMARHGGGAFSGKVPNKQDRSVAYMARYIAKNVVASGIADKCEVQLAYAIGYPEPVSVHVTSFGTGKIDDKRIEQAIRSVFDMTPAGIIKTLDLKRPIYRQTACYGHFGRPEFPWEKTDKINALKKYA